MNINDAERMKNSKQRLRIMALSISAIIFLIIIAGAVFFQYTPIGYCMSIQCRDFTETEHNIYIDNDYAYVTVNENHEFISKDNAATIINEAKSRVSDFFGGELQCDPVIIISDNSDIIRKIGDRNAYTFTLHRLFSYIAISHEYLNVDIIAHEITHAELYCRIMNGRPFQFVIPVPIWFNEGLASINDYSAKMSEETWKQKTDNGTKVRDITKFTKADFSGKSVNDEMANAFIVQENYLMCKHEVKAWLDDNGINALLSLIDGIRDGMDFEALYNE